MKFIYTFFLFLFISTHSFSQVDSTEVNTLEKQFDKIYRTSTSYQTYKVISKQRFLKLKSSVLDSIKSSQTIILDVESQLQTKEDTIQQLTKSISATKTSLESSLSKENSISLFGIQLSKGVYNLILWGIISLLAIGVLFFSFKFKNSHVITKKAEENLLEVESEFERFRKKTLLNEQQLRRKLQDEINKQQN